MLKTETNKRFKDVRVDSAALVNSIKADNAVINNNVKALSDSLKADNASLRREMQDKFAKQESDIAEDLNKLSANFNKKLEEKFAGYRAEINVNIEHCREQIMQNTEGLQLLTAETERLDNRLTVVES